MNTHALWSRRVWFNLEKSSLAAEIVCYGQGIILPARFSPIARYAALSSVGAVSNCACWMLFLLYCMVLKIQCRLRYLKSGHVCTLTCSSIYVPYHYLFEMIGYIFSVILRGHCISDE